MPLRHHPGIAVIEPIVVVAALAPARRRGLANLQGVAAAEGFAQGHQADAAAGRLAEKGLQELGTLVPPVAKQLGVEGGHQQGTPGHGTGQPGQLGGAAGQVIPGVVGGEGAGGGGVVGLLAIKGAITAADPVQLQAQGSGAADAGSRQLLGIEIPAQVAVEFPVGRLARIAIAGTPNRQGGLAIAAEEGHAGGGADRRIHPIAGPGQAMEQAVAIEHGVAQAAGHEQLVEALVVGTFRQPDPLGAHPQQPLVFPHRREQLGAHGLGPVPQQGQIAVGGGAGEQVEHPLLLQAPEAGHQVAAPGPPTRLGVTELAGQIVPGQAIGGWGPLEQLQPQGQPGAEALGQQGTAQQREQGGREPQAQPGPLAGVGRRRLEGVEQGQVTLEQGLEIPVLLQGARLAGMDIGQVGMEHQGQVPPGGCSHGTIGGRRSETGLVSGSQVPSPALGSL